MKASKKPKEESQGIIKTYTFEIEKVSVLSYLLYTPLMIFFITGVLALYWSSMNKSTTAFVGVVLGLFLMTWFLSILFYIRGESDE